ncbi:CoA pyrophosphatase [Phenylobacterium sp.]|uniref:NUDIX hydrolase n=1 Tax=Phenylobacterium sp. TaxID=1871053 RepID=UPI002727E834|nr:CoA pyrophosphatase [Phenylobacterium sp.]MDO8799057.1 CoA pyrophosphatase [Phenylobacterium sp.]
MHADRDTIAANLAAFPRRALDPTGRRRAAVAIVLSAQDGELTYLLTRRALTMRRGAGNYALPGGNLEPGEDAVTAAIRETSEELGVAITPREALGMLDDFLTLGGHIVTPVVFWSAETLSLNPDPIEVDRAWFEPVERLNHPDSPMSEDHPDGGEPILRMFADDNWINPPTAAWLYQFREVALHGRLIRVSMIGQPEWTAR